MPKERSRDAARSRRGKENYEFYGLAKMLPLPGAITSQLDKASIVRLTISYLKLRDFSSHGDPPWTREGPPPNRSVKGPQTRRNMVSVAIELYESNQGTHILQSLDGFAFALTNDGRFLYISETVSIYLGLSQVEMAGSSFFDYVHSGDHQELADHLGINLPQGGAIQSPSGSSPDETVTSPVMNPSLDEGYDRSFCIRMKSTLTKRGVHVKCSGYRVVHILSHMRPQYSFSMTRKHPPQLLGLVAIALALPPPTINEMRMDPDMFVMRLSPEFNISYCEARISDVMDLNADDLIGQNLYEFCHAEDLKRLQKSHQDLLIKGQVLTDYFRLMNKHGGYVWIQTCASMIINKNQPDDQQNTVAINYVLSGIEHGGCAMNCKQLDVSSGREQDSSDNSEEETGNDNREESTGDNNNNTGTESSTSNQENTAKKNSSSSRKYSSSHNNQIQVSSSKSDQLPHDVDSFILIGGQKEETNSLSSDNPSCDETRSCGSESPSDGNRGQKRRHDDLDLHLSIGYNRSPNSDANATCTVNADSNQSPVHVQNVSPHLPSPSTITPVPEDLSLGVRSHASTVTSEQPQQSCISSYKHVATSTNSVRELEEAMNRHLPSEAAYDSRATQKHKSAIQWIGHQPGKTTLPASNLLRHLYASRESVIRPNIYQTTRPTYYNDIPGVSMLTPPGEQATTSFGLPQMMSPIAQLQPETPPGTTPTTTDSYGMTPPASVSPHDKAVYPSPFDQAYAEAAQAAQIRQFDSADPNIRLPVYGMPGSTLTYDRASPQYSYYNYQGFSQTASTDQFR